MTDDDARPVSQIIGMVGTKEVSEIVGSATDGPAVDADYLTRFARAHDDAGFDRVLIGYSASYPDGFAVASHVLNHTPRLKVLIAHRPGFVQPTLVARKLATIDQLTGGGRVAIHHITGGSEADQRRDGDFADHDTRYARTGEFIEVLRRTLTSEEPFDHEGRFYRFEGAYSAVKAVHASGTDTGIPIFFGGQSPAAVEVSGRHTDVHMLFGEPLAQTAERIALLRAEAAKHGRTVQFSLSTRPVVADTEDEAWAKAQHVRDLTEQRLADAAGIYGRKGFFPRGESTSVGDARLRETAARQQVYDQRLWFGITALTGQGGNSSGHVGTPAQVADALAEYHAIGVDHFLIRGFDPLGDVEVWGRGLVPALRERLDSQRGSRVAEEAFAGAG